MPDHPSAPDTLYCLLYDGECPMCSTFAKIANSAENGQLKKIDAGKKVLFVHGQLPPVWISITVLWWSISGACIMAPKP